MRACKGRVTERILVRGALSERATNQAAIMQETLVKAVIREKCQPGTTPPVAANCWELEGSTDCWATESGDIWILE